MHHTKSLRGVRLVVGTLTAFVLLVAWNAAGATDDTDFTGFWKINCTDALGVQIKRADNGLWSLHFCGPGGCQVPVSSVPDTPILGDPSYTVVDQRTLVIRGDTYTKCSGDIRPPLDYGTAQAESAAAVVPLVARLGAPDYETYVPFTGRDPAIIAALRRRVRSAAPDGLPCVSGAVEVAKGRKADLYSNVCQPGVVRDLRRLVASLAPALYDDRLAFWVVTPGAGAAPVLFVTHLDIDPAEIEPRLYLNAWLIRIDDASYTVRHAGPFVGGRVWAVREFGNRAGRAVLFVRHVGCAGCAASEYLTAVDFGAADRATAYEFASTPRHDAYATRLPYRPTGDAGVSANLETRTLPASAGGPHVLQRFEGPPPGRDVEWRVYTCQEYRCDYRVERGRGSPGLRQLWSRGRVL
jgi:hypothetical protein